MKSPSEKQIKFADKIATALDLDFPRGDYDFNAQSYYNFIAKNIKEYQEKCVNYIPILEDSDDVFWGYDLGLWEF